MRYVVLGANGQLGRDLGPRLGGDVLALDRSRADLTQPGPLRAALDEARPDVVVNCAAYNFVDKAEGEPEAAFAVNAWGVRELARWCGRRDCLLVHFSTDHVFGLPAERRVPWAETDAPVPVNVYGQSKLVGEHQVRTWCPRHLILRTCGLYGLPGSGGKGGNFVETMLRLAGEGKPLRVVADQACTPSSTADVADATARLLAGAPPGRYHVTNAGATTWHDFAAAIFGLAGIRADLTPITSAALAAPAPRPRYSVLAASALAAAGLAPLRPWQAALAEYLEQRKRAGR
jgi:dTDP-4-dehydrorhamnose reductase